MTKKTIVLNGEKFHSLDGFYDEIEDKLTQNLDWRIGRNLDAFNDILKGGFGKHDYEEPITLIWTHSSKSEKALGWQATIQYLKIKLDNCHPANRNQVEADLQLATQHKGETLFQLIVKEVRSHAHIDFRLE